MQHLLRPRSIAVFGGKPALQVVRQAQQLGYRGDIWPVHPTHDSVAGLRAYRDIADLPAPPDAAFIAVNRHATVDLVRALAETGCGGAIAYAAGFAEAGPEGTALQTALIRAAGAMPLLGPNCYGLLNYLDGAALWPDQHGGARVPRGVAVVTQSGNIGCNITMQRRGLPLAYMVTLGNQAVLGLPAAIRALAQDDRVTAIGLHIEGIGDPTDFAAAVAAAGDTPIVALTTGGSAAGAALTISHTASLAGNDAVMGAFLRRIGVARVTSIPVLLETLKLLHVHGWLRGRDIASMSCSGGEAALIADRAEAFGLRFRPFTPAQHATIAATLPPLVTVSNPLDYHTFSWADGAALSGTFGAVLDCGFDLAALILDYPRTDRCDEADWLVASDALAASRGGHAAAVIATLPELLPESRAQALLTQGVVPLLGIDDALAAIAAAADPGPCTPPLTPPPPTGRAVLLDEAAAKRALAAHGVPVPRGHVVAAADAVAAATALGFPVVLKSLGVAHKTEHHAVRLNLRDAASVATAAADLGGMVLIEPMIADAVAELIVGIGRDPVIGPYLLLGSGGVLAELVGDRAILMLPAQDVAIRDAILSLRVAALLRGHRGRPPGDMDALIAAVAAIQGYALYNLHRLLELDVNPVLIRPRGAIAVDALIRLVEDIEP